MKNPIHIINTQSKIWCLTLLNDGRLVSGSDEITIYNKITFKPDLIIKEHTNSVYFVTQLSSGILASCSCDNTIKLFYIKENKFQTVQTLTYHTKPVFKLLELKNTNLISCSDDGNIIIYLKDKLNYKKSYQINTRDRCSSVIQTKDNKICYSLWDGEDTIWFYDLLKRKNIITLSNISKCNNQREWFIMISKDLLLIPGAEKITIININEYSIIRIIDVPGSEWLCGACLINKNMLLIGDNSKFIQWKIEKDNLNFFSQKEKTHEGWINILYNLGNGHIASGSDYKTIKIW